MVCRFLTDGRRDGGRERVSSNFEKKIDQYVRNILRKNLVRMKRGYLSGKMIPDVATVPQYAIPLWQSGRRPPVTICDFNRNSKFLVGEQ